MEHELRQFIALRLNNYYEGMEVKDNSKRVTNSFPASMPVSQIIAAIGDFLDTQIPINGESSFTITGFTVLNAVLDADSPYITVSVDCSLTAEQEKKALHELKELEEMVMKEKEDRKEKLADLTEKDFRFMELCNEYFKIKIALLTSQPAIKTAELDILAKFEDTFIRKYLD